MSQCGQRRDRYHRQIEPQSHTLGNAGGNSYSGKGAGSATEGNGIEIGEPDIRFLHDLGHHRQNQLIMFAWRVLVVLDDVLIEKDGGRAGLGCRFDGQEFHGQTSSWADARW